VNCDLSFGKVKCGARLFMKDFENVGCSFYVQFNSEEINLDEK